ncbi:MAG: Coenzyme F420 hydrogenase/dehydrogenase, beta subunit C-terminal domain [Candidatus Thorarchaeota archaeon]
MVDEKIETKSQVIDYLQSNFLGIGFQELNDLVISNQNCVFCGACISLCPRIGMNEKEPELIDNDPECSICFRYCSRTYFPEDLLQRELFHDGAQKSYPLGFYQKLVTAKSTENEVLRVAQNGGVVSSLLIHALESGLIDGVILTDKDEKWVPKPVIARTSSEILSYAGSKYTIAPTLSIYKDAINEFKLKKLAFVGLPCQTHSVRKFQLSSPLSKEYGKFTLIIGLYCYSNYSYDLMTKFVQGELRVPLKNVEKIDISRGKFYAYLKDGSFKAVPIQKTKKFSWQSCQYCKDYSAEIADISVGSVGALKNDWNSVILRTDIGTKLFNEAVEANKLITSDKIDLFKIEQESLRKKTQLAQMDKKILFPLQILNIPEFEIRTYLTLMLLGSADESILSKVMKVEKKTVKTALKTLKQRQWIIGINSLYNSVNPTIVFNNEIHKLRKEFSEKIGKLKREVLPNLETLYAQNNFKNLRYDDDLNLI